MKTRFPRPCLPSSPRTQNSGPPSRAFLSVFCVASVLAFAVLPSLSSPLLGAAAGQHDHEALSAPATRDSVRLTCVVLHGGTGEALDARCTIADAYGHPRWPAPAESCLYHEASWSHGPYFYANAPFSVDVPPGPTFVGASHGVEFSVYGETVLVSSDTLLTITLDPTLAGATPGWYSGDCHVHYCHPGGSYELDIPGMFCLSCAEDIQFLHCLDNTHGFCGGPDPCSRPGRVVYITEEQRSSVYGHSGFLGLSSLVEPFHTTWEPLISTLAESVHEQPNGVVISAHPVSTDDFFDLDSGPSATMLARTLPVDVLSGEIDGFEVLSYSNYHHFGRELDLWYRLLNCGFELTACAGTDACPNNMRTAPVGGYRVYVCTDEPELCCDSWLAGLRSGRTFVTNGPLVTSFEIDGARPGQTVSYEEEFTVLAGSVSIESVLPVSRVDVVRNGETAMSFCLPPGCCAFDTTFSLPTCESCWVAARVFGQKNNWATMGDSLFAHTTPVYVTLAGRRVAVHEDAEALAEWVENLEELAEDRGEWISAADSAAAFAAFAGARSFYDNLASGAQTDVDESPPTPVASSEGGLSVWPNPTRDGVALMLSTPGTCRGRVTVHTVSGRLVRVLVGDDLNGGACSLRWDGTDTEGRRVAAGIYLVSAKVGERSETAKVVLLR